VVNLAPADKRKEGTFFDLPIAVGILNAIEEVNLSRLENFNNTIFLGELSLDGKINGVNGVLPMCIEAMNLGIKRVVVPKENSIEARIIKGLEIIAVENLEEVIDYIRGDIQIDKEDINEEISLNNNINYNVDFSEVKGQENAKRALEIAAARGT
jgi:magnesium chelatase family protein